MTRHFKFLLLFSLFLSPVHAVSTSDQVLLGHLRYLASDEMRGRGNSQPELQVAAEYIARNFQKYGLKPAGLNGSFFQEFEIVAGHSLGEKAQIQVVLEGEELQLKPHQDYSPLSYGPQVVAAGPLVFAGFGISANDLNYDDYRDLDVTGKIVLVSEGVPRKDDEGRYLSSREISPYGSRMHKIMNAKHRGAAAILFRPERNSSDQERTVFHEIEDLGIHALRLKREIPREGCASISLEVKKVYSTVRNVLGFIPGQTDEVIVIGAHYDHLGLGDHSSLAPGLLGEIHNGADDNASGTAGLLQLARDLARTPRKRGLLFIAFAAEEIGLRGSDHYTERPTIRLEKTIAMINLDMIGRSEGDLIIGGVGTAPEFRNILSDIQKNSPLEFKYSDSVRGSSDHQSFASVEVPALFFFSGLHEDYHQPSDDWEKINIVRTYQILDVVRETIAYLDQGADSPTFVEARPPARAQRARGYRNAYGPLFGSIPDMSWDLGGVRFSDIRPGTPADKAGVQTGDILVEFDGKKIDNLYDFTYALRLRKRGDEVEVVVLRDDRPLRVKVELGER
ncbi:MAG: M28 family peptidase [Acidobacteriota bacterium]